MIYKHYIYIHIGYQQSPFRSHISPYILHLGIPAPHLHVIGFHAHARLHNASNACPEDRAQEAPECLERGHSEQSCNRCNRL
jgi:hypothetical protein